MHKALELLPEASVPVTLFTRHSLREIVAGQGLAGYDLQLTEQGRDLAHEWGAYLIKNTDRFSIVFRALFSAVLIQLL